jgi:hypothetical protein
MTSPTEPRQSFLERRPIRRALRRWLDNWLERHQHPFSRRIHYVGIPLSLLVAPVLLFALPWDQWYWAATAFVGGYVLQWVGHRVEGNDMGELAGVKRLLGLPYVAVSPRWHRPVDQGPTGG